MQAPIPTQGQPRLGDLVSANLRGQQQAKQFIEMVRGTYADPDALYAEMKTLIPESRDIEALTVMRGFLRIIQKRLEAAE